MFGPQREPEAPNPLCCLLDYFLSFLKLSDKLVSSYSVLEKSRWLCRHLVVDVGSLKNIRKRSFRLAKMRHQEFIRFLCTLSSKDPAAVQHDRKLTSFAPPG